MIASEHRSERTTADHMDLMVQRLNEAIADL